MNFGYIRVSTKEQNEDRQLIALSQFDIPDGNLYMDKLSGKDFQRPAYRQLLRRLRPNDVLIVKSIDRLGRNYKEIMEQWRVITKEKCADIKVLDTPLLDTTYCKDLLGTFIADLVLAVMSYTAQMERENIRQRQAEGIAAAKERGVRFGRPRIPLPEDFLEYFDLLLDGTITMEQLARHCGMARNTLSVRMQEICLPEYGGSLWDAWQRRQREMRAAARERAARARAARESAKS